MSLTVRERAVAETDLIVDYFLNSTPEHLEILGVDPTRFPPAASGGVATKIVRPLLRHVHADVYRTLSLALYRSRGTLGGCARLGRRVIGRGFFPQS